jgi:hypothetical protein
MHRLSSKFKTLGIVLAFLLLIVLMAALAWFSIAHALGYATVFSGAEQAPAWLGMRYRLYLIWLGGVLLLVSVYLALPRSLKSSGQGDSNPWRQVLMAKDPQISRPKIQRVGSLKASVLLLLGAATLAYWYQCLVVRGIPSGEVLGAMIPPSIITFGVLLCCRAGWHGARCLPGAFARSGLFGRLGLALLCTLGTVGFLFVALIEAWVVWAAWHYQATWTPF